MFKKTIGFLFFALSIVFPVFAQWATESVDSVYSTSQSSIEIDGNGDTNIAYYDSVNGNLKLATEQLGSWVATSLDGTSGDDVGGTPYLDAQLVAGSTRLFVSYYDITNGNLKFAQNFGQSTIAVEVIDSTGDVGLYSVLTHTDATSYISYYDVTNANLKVAYRNSSKVSTPWTISAIDTAGNVGKHTSIAANSSHDLFVSYYDETNGNLKFAKRISGTWSTETVDGAGGADVGRFTSIKINGSDHAFISYRDDTNNDLKYATNETGVWVIETVDSTGNVGKYTSLALDASANAHISYFDANNDDLKYATNETGSWVRSVVDSTGSVGYFTNIIFNEGTGDFQISYFDNTNDELRHAYGP